MELKVEILATYPTYIQYITDLNIVNQVVIYLRSDTAHEISFLNFVSQLLSILKETLQHLSVTSSTFLLIKEDVA